MAKKSIRYIRLILTGLIWIPIYLDVSARIVYGLFDFNTINPRDWAERIQAFKNGEWVIDTGRDWGVLWSMILFIPLLIAGWVFVYRFKWSKLFARRKAVVKAPGAGFDVGAARRVFEPAKLRVQSSAILTVPMTSAPQAGQEMENGVVTPPVSAPVQPAGQQATTPTYEDEEDVRRMLATTASVQADFFPHVNLEGHYASFALSTEKQAVIVNIINRPDSVWAVDTEVPPEESDWFDQTSLLPTPAKDVMAISKSLHDNEPDSTAIPTILLMSGKLLNIDETIAYFEKHNIMLLRMMEAEADEVPLFEDFVREYFAKPSENTEQS